MDPTAERDTPDILLVTEVRHAFATGEFRRLRKTARLTQVDVAAWIGGISPMAVTAWENGRARPSAEHAVALYDLMRRLRAIVGMPA